MATILQFELLKPNQIKSNQIRSLFQSLIDSFTPLSESEFSDSSGKQLIEDVNSNLISIFIAKRKVSLSRELTRNWIKTIEIWEKCSIYTKKRKAFRQKKFSSF